MDLLKEKLRNFASQLKNRLGANAVPIQLNIGSEENFKGVVDLVRMKAIHWDEETKGSKFELLPIPSDLQAKCDELREELIAAAAEATDALMEKYLENLITE